MTEKEKQKLHNFHTFHKEYSQLSKQLSIATSIPQKFIILQKVLSLGNTNNHSKVPYLPQRTIQMLEDLISRKVYTQEHYFNDLSKMIDGTLQWNKMQQMKSVQKKQPSIRQNSSKRLLHSSHSIGREKQLQNTNWKIIPEFKQVLCDRKKYKRLRREQIVQKEKIGLKSLYNSRFNRKKQEQFIKNHILQKNGNSEKKILKKVQLKNNYFKKNSVLQVQIQDLKEKAINHFGVQFQQTKKNDDLEMVDLRKNMNYFKAAGQKSKEKARTFHCSRKNKIKVGKNQITEKSLIQNESIPLQYINEVRRKKHQKVELKRRRSNIRYIRI